MKREIVILVAKSIWFYSQNDETAFFEWLDKINCIAKYEGRGDLLYIEVRPEEVNEVELRELLALFHRYGVDKKQLAEFDRLGLGKWFRSEKSYWFLDVFGTKKLKKSQEPRDSD